MWLFMQQRQGLAESRARMAALAVDESHPATCGGRLAEETQDAHGDDK
jgi:hypothetical protein